MDCSIRPIKTNCHFRLLLMKYATKKSTEPLLHASKTSKREISDMRLRNVLRVIAVVIFVFGLSQAASAQRWVFLGDKHVDGHDDHDKISVGSKEGTFRQLQIRVKLAPVVFQRVVVP